MEYHWDDEDRRMKAERNQMIYKIEDTKFD
jgi:hypothetical protein